MIWTVKPTLTVGVTFWWQLYKKLWPKGACAFCYLGLVFHRWVHLAAVNTSSGSNADWRFPWILKAFSSKLRLQGHWASSTEQLPNLQPPEYCSHPWTTWTGSFLKMSDSGSSERKNFKKEELEESDEENVILTLVPVEDPVPGQLTESDISSTGDIKPEHPEANSKVLLLETKPSQRSRSKEPTPPVPDILPPINDVSRNTLRYWCQQFNHSTNGEKIDVYLRLQRHA